MKLILSVLAFYLFIIDDVQNVPIIHPIHLHTIPLNPATVRPTPTSMTTGKSAMPSVTTIGTSKNSWWHGNSSTQFMTLISSPSSTTHHHSSPWNNSNSAISIIFRIVIYIIAMGLVYKILDIMCHSKKTKKANKANNPVTVTNEKYVSTIDGKLEGLPPPYGAIHNV